MVQEEFSEGFNEFRSQVLEGFGYLLTDFGFTVCQQRDVGRGEHCLIVLQSVDCSLKFIFDRGGIEVYAGARDADPNWDADETHGKEWYGLATVIDFVSGKGKLTMEEVLNRSKAEWEMSGAEYLLHLASLLRPVLKEVCFVFGRSSPLERRRALDAYLSDS